MIDDDKCGAVGGMKLAGETAALGRNLPQCQFVEHKYHMTCPRIELGQPRWEAGD
jgi:hypothetical protein